MDDLRTLAYGFLGGPFVALETNPPIDTRTLEHGISGRPFFAGTLTAPPSVIDDVVVAFTDDDDTITSEVEVAGVYVTIIDDDDTITSELETTILGVITNRWYPLGHADVVGGVINWVTADIRVALVKTSYTFSDWHQFMSSVGAANINGRTSASITNKTVVGRVLDGDDISFVASAAVACDALVVYVHTGNDATAKLLMYINMVVPNRGLPITPTVNQVLTIVWNNGSNHIAVKGA